MECPAPLAKISPPRSAKAYLRTRALHSLHEALDHPLVWIASPAGSGKTTLVASYLQKSQRSSLWYQVDAGDRDIASFFHHLGLGVVRATPRFRRPLPKLTPEYLGHVSTFARNFFREIARRARPPFALVFDNLQEVGDEAPLYEVLCAGLSELPEGFHTMLISRNAPPAAFARLYVNRKLVRLGWDDFKLQENELGECVRFFGMPDMSADALSTLHRQCDGWMAGLILLLGGARADDRRPLDPANAQALFDYFAAEVFERRSPSARDFLMQTALFQNFTAAMAEQLTGHDRARVLLNDLVRQHHFLERHDEPRPMYQFHPLFNAFLREQATIRWGQDELMRQRHRAAVILEQAGDGEQALPLYLAASDTTAAVRLILAQAPQFIADGRLDTLRAAIEQFASDVLEHEPWLLYWLGVSRMPFDLCQSRTLFERAFHLALPHQQPALAYLAWSGVIDSIMGDWDDLTDVDAWVEAFDGLRAREPIPPEALTACATSFLTVILYRRSPDHFRLPDWLWQAQALLERKGNDHQRAVLGTQLALYCLFVGITESRSLLNTFANHNNADHTNPLLKISWYASRAMIEVATGPTATLLAVCEAGLKLAEQTGIHIHDTFLLGLKVFGHLRAGDHSAAQVGLRQIDAMTPLTAKLNRTFIHSIDSMVSLRIGRIERAVEQGRLGVESSRTVGAWFHEVCNLLVCAQATATQGDTPTAQRLIGEARAIGQRARSPLVSFWSDLQEAVVLTETDKRGQAIEPLRRALNIAASQGLVFSPWCSRETVSILCSLALEHEIEVVYVRELIHKSELAPPPEATDHWPWPLKITTLGRFSIRQNDKTLPPSRKSQKKPLELLKALIALGGRNVREEKLAHILWPNAEADSAAIVLATTVHRCVDSSETPRSNAGKNA